MTSSPQQTDRLLSIRLTERILGGDRFGQLDRVTDTVHVSGRDAEHVLVLFVQVCHLGGQLTGLADLLPRLPLEVLLLDDVVGDRAAAVAVWNVPLQVGRLRRQSRHRQVAWRRRLICVAKQSTSILLP